MSCLALLALTACGSNTTTSAPIEPPFEEGTRLKAVYQQAEGAPPLFLNWYDTELGLDCLFADVGLADRQVCFPTSAPGTDPRAFFARKSSFFSNSRCSQALTFSFFEEHNVVLEATETEESCAGHIRLFRVGPKVAPETTLYLDSDASTLSRCGPAYLETPEAPFFAVGAEIPLDTLVSGTFQPGPGPGRIVELRIAGSDGSIQHAGNVGRMEVSNSAEAYPGVVSRWAAWDMQRSEPVLAQSFVPLAEPRWLPNIAEQMGGYFSDATCSTAVETRLACPPPPSLAYSLVSPLDACGNSTPTLLRTGSQVPKPEQLYYFDVDARRCTASQVQASLIRTFAPSTPLPTETFAPLTKIRTGTERLQLIQAATPGGRAALPLGFWDTALDQPCSASPSIVAADGSLRCLPDAFALTDFNRIFADAACSERLLSQNDALAACQPPRKFASRSERLSPTDPLAPSSVVHFFPLGNRHQGSIYVLLPDDTCSPTSAIEGETVYELEAELDPNDLAPVTLVRPH